MRRAAPTPNRSAIDLIDEAFHLVRRTPGNILMLYFLGAVPFLMLFLFFWADMSQGPVSGQRLARAALGVAGAYLWMKFWHAVYGNRVREWITGEEGRKWSLSRVLRVAALQGLIQPFGLVLKPVSLIVPFLFLVPVLTFFSVVSVEGARQENASKLVARGLALAFFRPLESYQVIALLLLFGIALLINFITLILAVPFLLQVLFAVDTEFMRAGWSAGNSTFFMSAFALTYLALDPLLKAVFTLRSYHWDARTTGEDLAVELKRVRRDRRPRGAAAVTLLLVSLLGGSLVGLPGQVIAAESAGLSETVIPADRLDEQIDRVLSQREYLWRLPPPAVEEEEAGLLRRFVDSIGETIREIWMGAGRMAARLAEWLVSIFFRGDQAPAQGRPARDWSGGLQITVLALGVALVVLVGLILWQAWKKRRRIGAAEGEGPLVPKPDLEDESVTADALPVGEWSRLAAEYKAKGEFRLALRASYLATLAALADENLVVLARAKSNREYQEELWRRAHDQSDRIEAFRQNCLLYERAWYGMYPVDGDMLFRFEVNQKRISPHETVITR